MDVTVRRTFHGRFFLTSGSPSHWGLRTRLHCGNGSCRGVARFSNTKDPEKCVGMCCYHVGVIFVTFTVALIHQDFSPGFGGQVGMLFGVRPPPQKTGFARDISTFGHPAKNWIERMQEAKAAINGLDGHMLQGRRFLATKMWRERRTQTETSGFFPFPHPEKKE